MKTVFLMMAAALFIFAACNNEKETKTTTTKTEISYTVKNDNAEKYDSLCDLAWNFIDKAELENAMTALDDAIKILPNDPWAYNLKGRFYGRANDYEKAKEWLLKSIEVKPTGKAYNDLGVTYSMMRYDDDAIKSFDMAIETDPDYADTYMNRANYKNMSGDNKGALEDIEKGIELEPESGKWYNAKAILLNLLGDTDKACEAIDKAIELGFPPAENTKAQICN